VTAALSQTLPQTDVNHGDREIVGRIRFYSQSPVGGSIQLWMREAKQQRATLITVASRAAKKGFLEKDKQSLPSQPVAATNQRQPLQRLSCSS